MTKNWTPYGMLSLQTGNVVAWDRCATDGESCYYCGRESHGILTTEKEGEGFPNADGTAWVRGVILGVFAIEACEDCAAVARNDWNRPAAKAWLAAKGGES